MSLYPTEFLETIALDLLRGEEKRHMIDGWLGYDFRGKNHLLLHLLGLSPDAFLTRRFFYWVRKGHSPVKVVHKIDEPSVYHIPGRTISYTSNIELESTLLSLIAGSSTIAMEYWPNGSIPILSIIDAGVREFVESTGARVIPSWPLIGPYAARMSKEQHIMHKKAAHILKQSCARAWEYLKRETNNGKTVTEVTLQSLIIDSITQQGACFDHPPIVACNAHSAIPHFETKPETNMRIGANSVVLIDAWCRMKSSRHAVYADLTDMLFTGNSPPDHLNRLFSAALDAQQKTIDYLSAKYEANEIITGREVDLFSRSIIKEKGLLNFCLHRTGHNIFTSVHGPSTNFDSYETSDTRQLYPYHCYSIEPGLYIPGAYGIRLECNISLLPNGSVHVERIPGIEGKAIRTIREIAD